MDDDDGSVRAVEAPDVLRDACGRASEAFEYVIRVRGHLYSAHQLTGRADFLFEEAAALFDRAGQHEDAARLRREVVGRNLLDGRWTYQIVEEFDDGYYAEVASCVRALQLRHAGGRRHDHEAQLKAERRTKGRPGHEAQPAT